MKAKLGMSPIAWWNDDLVELSDDVSLEECLRQSRSAGFTGMEKGRRFPEDPDIMLPILRKADVTLCGGWFSGTLVNEDMAANKDRIQPMIDLFKAVNAPCIVYGEVGRSIQGDRSKPLATKPRLSDDEMKAYAKRLTEFELSGQRSIGTNAERECSRRRAGIVLHVIRAIRQREAMPLIRRVEEEAGHVATEIDGDRNRAEGARVVDRDKHSVLEPKPVHYIAGIVIGSDDFARCVDPRHIRQDCAGKVDGRIGVGNGHGCNRHRRSRQARLNRFHVHEGSFMLI